MTDTQPHPTTDPVHVHVREHLISEGLHEIDSCFPNAETLLVAIQRPGDGPPEVECLGVVNHDKAYVNFGPTTGEEDGLAKAGELIARALSISLPPYLRQTDDDPEMYEIAIADTAYGKTRHR
jgi:hypothetical protein